MFYLLSSIKGDWRVCWYMVEIGEKTCYFDSRYYYLIKSQNMCQKIGCAKGEREWYLRIWTGYECIFGGGLGGRVHTYLDETVCLSYGCFVRYLPLYVCLSIQFKIEQCKILCQIVYISLTSIHHMILKYLWVVSTWFGVLVGLAIRWQPAKSWTVQRPPLLGLVGIKPATPSEGAQVR